MANHSAPRATSALRVATASVLLGAPLLASLPLAASAAPGEDPTTRVLELTNAERAKAGCGEVTRDTRIDRAAEGYAQKMASSGRFSHTGADGSKFTDRMKKAGYQKPGGENIAQGQDGAAEVMGAWMDSPGHKRNILDCSFRTIGLGHAGDDDYWVQNFGR